MIKSMIRKRRLIHGVTSVIIIGATMLLHVSLGVVLAIGMAVGAVFGKVFCRWMCPVGFLMEGMMGADKNSKNIQMYNYHKLGCPIAWVSGFMNRFSLFKIRRDKDKCVDCGICDKACYIAMLNENYSQYDNEKKPASTQYSCSRCLACVGECPMGSLKYTIKR